LKVLLKRLKEDAKIPCYAHEGDAGLDLFSAEEVTIEPGERKLIGTGFNIAVEKGYEAQVRPKSGLAINYGIGVLNSPGTIDASYRGEIKVIVINHSKEPFTIGKGTKIAQMVLTKIEKAEIVEVKELDETSRNKGGFGSTGLE